jgi:hypothetical protein
VFIVVDIIDTLRLEEKDCTHLGGCNTYLVCKRMGFEMLPAEWCDKM